MKPGCTSPGCRSSGCDGRRATCPGHSSVHVQQPQTTAYLFLQQPVPTPGNRSRSHAQRPIVRQARQLHASCTLPLPLSCRLRLLGHTFDPQSAFVKLWWTKDAMEQHSKRHRLHKLSIALHAGKGCAHKQPSVHVNGPLAGLQFQKPSSPSREGQTHSSDDAHGCSRWRGEAKPGERQQRESVDGHQGGKARSHRSAVRGGVKRCHAPDSHSPQPCHGHHRERLPGSLRLLLRRALLISPYLCATVSSSR